MAAKEEGRVEKEEEEEERVGEEGRFASKPARLVQFLLGKQRLPWLN